MIPYCQICGVVEARLVRDHNHRTMLIRGILCEVCNSYLGVYEKNKFRLSQRGRRNYKAWASMFEQKIEDFRKRLFLLHYPLVPFEDVVKAVF